MNEEQKRFFTDALQQDFINDARPRFWRPTARAPVETHTRRERVKRENFEDQDYMRYHELYGFDYSFEEIQALRASEENL